MTATPESRLALLMELVRIPGITATREEDSTARFIYGRLADLTWFREHPEFLELIPTPLEGDKRPLHAVLALALAARPTKHTVILTGHFDVVDTAVYGDLRDVAFDPDTLAARLRSEALDPAVARDLASGNFLFGRGSMDMKCGVAAEMELLRDFSENRGLFDVNLLLLLVPDEENASAGMRGAIPRLVEMRRELGLEFLAAINAEPTEAGLPTAKHPTIFLGTVGKLMPAFLCLGRESHVGAYYDGLNAALLSSRILVLAEGNPDLADPAGGICCPSWICLEHRILREGYSVTVPGASIVYFNCYATASSPATVLGQMRRVAEEAATDTVERLRKSRTAMIRLGVPENREPDWKIPVYNVEEMRALAISRVGENVFEERLNKFMEELEEPDPREAGISVMRKLCALAGEAGPLVLHGFLPPYYPPRSSHVPGPRFEALRQAADDVIEEAHRKFGATVEKAQFFTGLCDLSYFGFQGKPEDLPALERNLPGWGKIYSAPLEALSQLNAPVLNFGPSGRDPHKKTERLEKKWSFVQYPELLEFLVRSIAKRNA